MTCTTSILDIPDLYARRHLGANADATQREEFISERYLGRFYSKADCVKDMVFNYDLLGRHVTPKELPTIDLGELVEEMFESTLTAVEEGGAVHVFARA